MNTSNPKLLNIDILNLPNYRSIEVGRGDFFTDISDGRLDGLIIEGLRGFNDLGYFGNIIDKFSIKHIESLISVNKNKEEITVMSFPYKKIGTTLKAIAIVPTEHYRCYEKLAVPFYGKPYRDFHYNTVFEALGLLAGYGCSDIAIAGLTGSTSHCDDMDLRNCVTEALAHFALENKSLHRVLSVGVGPDLSEAVQFFNEHPAKVGQHRKIRSEIITTDSVTFLIFYLPQK